MALSTIGTNSIADDAVGNTKLDLTANYSFTGTISGAGQLVLLNTTTIGNDSTVNFDNSLITSTYKHYKIVCIMIAFATDGADFYLSPSQDNGSNFAASNSYVHCNFYDDTFRMSRATSQSSIRIGSSVDGNNSDHHGTFSGIIDVFDPSNTSNSKTFKYETVSSNQSGVAVNFRNGNAIHESNTALNYLRLNTSTGNLATGTVKLYGVK